MDEKFMAKRLTQTQKELRDVSYLVRDRLWSVQLVGSRARGAGGLVGLSNCWVVLAQR